MPKKDQTINHVDDLFSYATSGIEPQRSRWRKNYKYWKATNKKERPSYKDTPRLPYIYRYTKGLISILTDNNPQFIFMPQEEGDIETADQLQQVIGDYYWNKLKMTDVSEDLIWWACAISGSGLLRWGIDRSTRQYYIKALNSFCCYPDPGAKDLDQLNFFIYASMWSLNDVKRSFKNGDEVKPQPELNRLFDDDDPILSPWARTSEKSENLIGVLSKSAFKVDYGRVMLFEVWEQDTSTEKIPVDADTIIQEHEQIRAGQVPQIDDSNHHPEHIRAHNEFAASILDDPMITSDYAQIILSHIEEHVNHPNADDTERLKYPRGKVTVTANDVVLEKNVQAPFGMAMSKMDFVRDPLCFWGKTIGEYGQTLQDNIERAKAMIADHRDRTANPREFYLPQSGYNPTNVHNVAAEQVPVSIIGGVWWENTPNLNPYVMEDLLHSEKSLETIMNYPPVMRGEKPPGETSGVLIAELKESLGPEIRNTVKHFEGAMIPAAYGLVEMVDQTENPTKIYTILGENSKPIRINKDSLNLGGELDIRIRVGSTLPTSRMAKENKALQFFQMGLYDQEAALKYCDDPQAPEVLQRMNIIKQQAQMIEEQQNLIEQMDKQLEQTERANNAKKGEGS